MIKLKWIYFSLKRCNWITFSDHGADGVVLVSSAPLRPVQQCFQHKSNETFKLHLDIKTELRWH